MPVHSKRASILSKALKYLNNDSDDWDELDGFMVFGKDAFESWLGDPSAVEDSDWAKVRDLFIQFREKAGARVVAGKITLSSPASGFDILPWLNTLEPEQRHRLTEVFQEAILMAESAPPPQPAA